MEREFQMDFKVMEIYFFGNELRKSGRFLSCSLANFHCTNQSIRETISMFNFPIEYGIAI